MILKNGADYARWMRHASLPRRVQIDTSRSFRSAYLAIAGDVVHSHGPRGDHSHAGVAFTTWLDPQQAIAQARAVAVALSRARPEEADGFESRADSL